MSAGDPASKHVHDRLRRRFLGAMGFTLLAGCGGDPPPPVVAVAPPTPAPSPSPPTTTPSSTPSAAPSPTPVNEAPPPPPAPPASSPATSSPSITSSWVATFPRPNAQPWCKTLSAQCVEGLATDVAKCPPKMDVSCDYRFSHGAMQNDDAPCTGELLGAISRRERASHPKGACCYDLHERCPHPGEGRPLRARWDEAPIVAPITQARDAKLSTDAPHDDARTKRWLDAARAEHASIAAFAKVSLHLIAYGAPADLLRAVHEAAIDEVEHARMSFALAHRFSGARAPAVPGPMPLPASLCATPPFADFVRETFRDGCVGEMEASLRARRLEREASDDVEREALRVIADDEERHAELAWRILRWASERDPQAVQRVLEEEKDYARGEHVTDVIAPCRDALVSFTSSPEAPPPQA